MIVRLRNPLPIEALAPYQLMPADPPVPFSWSDVFGNDRPVELEVGHGKGWFMLASALERPEVNLVGIEVSRKRHLFTANRLAKRGLTHARVILAKAQDILEHHVAPESLAAIHVYFPDPWWKKRHEKRRVVTAPFLAACARALFPHGVLHLASDVPDRFAAMVELVAAEPAFAPLGDGRRDAAGIPNVIGNFEAKALRAGRPIQRASFERVGGSTDSACSTGAGGAADPT